MPTDPVPWSRLQRLGSQDLNGLLDELWESPGGFSLEDQHADWEWHIDDDKGPPHDDHGDHGQPEGIQLQARGRLTREEQHADWEWHIDDDKGPPHDDHGDHGQPEDFRILHERLELYLDQLEEVLVQREAQMASGLIAKVRGALSDVTDRLSLYESRLYDLERNVGRLIDDN